MKVVIVKAIFLHKYFKEQPKRKKINRKLIVCVYVDTISLIRKNIVH